MHSIYLSIFTLATFLSTNRMKDCDTAMPEHGRKQVSDRRIRSPPPFVNGPHKMICLCALVTGKCVLHFPFSLQILILVNNAVILLLFRIAKMYFAYKRSPQLIIKYHVI